MRSEPKARAHNASTTDELTPPLMPITPPRRRITLPTVLAHHRHDALGFGGGINFQHVCDQKPSSCSLWNPLPHADLHIVRG